MIDLSELESTLIAARKALEDAMYAADYHPEHPDMREWYKALEAIDLSIATMMASKP